ncbi:MAG TPA: MSMEG_0569 family flavin-dependent oxidoreductase [Polyangiales bacterium]|nr:MSMEG_0569 family flavin-dependent oxidoreductase [Polyangiales bacterium]
MTTHDSSILDHVPVIIVGGGQAGLSMSYCLAQKEIRHIVLEKHRIAHAWRSQRWDSFCLVTPNWQCQLPGHPYDGADSDGFMVKDQIIDYVERYAARFQAPVQEGVEVHRITKRDDAFLVASSLGNFLADQVVMAAGGYHRIKIPPLAAALDADVLQLDPTRYRNPSALPDGAVMIVGTGQSGCQIAEDLHLAGREVHLCVGSAPRVARRYRGKDVVAWLDRLGHYDLPIDKHPDGVGVRKKRNHYVTGRDGGRDIDLRKFAAEGMHVHGRLNDITRSGFEFGNDLEDNLDKADASSERIKRTIDAFIDREKIDAPIEAPYTPVWKPEHQATHLSHADGKIGSVIWCGGFALDYGFVELPAFDESGYPKHERGVVSSVPGLYFLGLPWQYTWGSGRFCGVGRDAVHLAEHVETLIGA